ncbi:MAG: hypothetical protein PWP48_125 [Clostridiales bacterium]|nr:hypothetical protein [Clostridiales bacterium]
MDCDKVKELLPLYIDGELSDDEMKAVSEHLADCPQCMEEYEQSKNIAAACKDLGFPAPPPDYKERVIAAVEKDSKKQRKGMFGAAAAVIAAALLIFISISSIGDATGTKGVVSGLDGMEQQEQTAPSQNQALTGSDSFMGDESRAVSEATGSSPQEEGMASIAEAPQSNDKADQDTSAEEAPDTSKSAEQNLAIVSANTEQRKIIKSAYLSLETEKFDNTVNSIIGRATALGGYVSNSEYNNRNEGKRTAHIEIKIPQQSFEQYLGDMGGYGKVVEDRRSGQDVTAQYIDTETRLKMLKIKEERLMELLSKAETLQDMFTIQDQLTNTQIEIERLTGDLKRWDDMVSYSTAVVDIYEVAKIEPEQEDNPNIWKRIGKAFVDSIKAIGRFFEGFIVFLFGAVPYLVLIGIVAWGVVTFIKSKRRI